MVFFVFILMVIAVVFQGYEPNIWWLVSLALFWIGDGIFSVSNRFKEKEESEYEEWEGYE